MKSFPKSKLFYLLIAVGLCTAAASSIQPLLVAAVVDSIRDGKSVKLFLGGLLVVIAVILLAELLSKIVTARYTQTLRDKWRGLLLDKVFTEQKPDSSIISQVNNDVETVIGSLYLGKISFILSLAGLGFAAIGLTVISPIFLVLIACCGLAMLGVPIIFRKKISAKKQKALSQANKWNKLLAQTVTAALTFRRRNSLKLRLGLVDESSRQATKAKMSAEVYEGSIDILIGGVLFVNQFLIILFGWLLIKNGTISLGELVAAIQFEDLLLTPMLSITDSLTDIAGGKDIAHNLKQRNETSAVNIKIISQKLKTLTADSGDNTGTAAASDKPRNAILIAEPAKIVIEDSKISLSCPELAVKPGDLILLTGQSGTGKSTLLRLLAGEIPDPNFTIYRQGIISYLPAEEPEFADSFKYDVTLGRESKAENISKAIAIVDPDSTRITDMFRADRSSGASLGERQRISLIRALLDSPNLLILDESLSHLDKDSTAAILANLRQESQLAVILVTHAIPDFADYSHLVTQHWQILSDGTQYRIRIHSVKP